MTVSEIINTGMTYGAIAFFWCVGFLGAAFFFTVFWLVVLKVFELVIDAVKQIILAIRKTY